MTIRKYEEDDIDGMIAVWNEIVEAGDAFPQEEPLTHDSGKDFFAAQTYTGVALDEVGEVVGLYILHPNNVGRCGHICNASYAVRSDCRGRDCLVAFQGLREEGDEGADRHPPQHRLNRDRRA